MNNVSLVGRLTKDVDLRQTQSGKAVGNFTLAVNRKYKNQNGEYEADFIRCTIWGKAAESLAQHQGKGSLIGVNGEIQTDSYENQNGQRVFTTKVNAQSVDFLEFKNKGQNNGGGQRPPQQNNPYNQGGNQAPPQYQQGGGQQFNNQQNYGGGQVPPQQFNNQQNGQMPPVDISDDDLPF